MSEPEQPGEFDRAKVIAALRELQEAWEGDFPSELPPEVAEKMRKLRDEVEALLGRLEREL